MCGVAEGIGGLALSAISVAALFTTCIECFDIVVAGKNFSEDYEQLCALVSDFILCVSIVLTLCSSLYRGRGLDYGANRWAWCPIRMAVVCDMTRTSIGR